MNKRAAIASLGIALALAVYNKTLSPAEASQPIPIETSHIEHKEEMVLSLTAYFNTHHLTAADIESGLTIHWISNDSNNEDHGYLVATGDTTQTGEVIFKSTIINDDASWKPRQENLIAFKP